jgi:hypothetical protein
MMSSHSGAQEDGLGACRHQRLAQLLGNEAALANTGDDDHALALQAGLQ